MPKYPQSRFDTEFPAQRGHRRRCGQPRIPAQKSLVSRSLSISLRFHGEYGSPERSGVSCAASDCQPSDWITFHISSLLRVAIGAVSAGLVPKWGMARSVMSASDLGGSASCRHELEGISLFQSVDREAIVIYLFHGSQLGSSAVDIGLVRHTGNEASKQSRCRRHGVNNLYPNSSYIVPTSKPKRGRAGVTTSIRSFFTTRR